MESVRGMLFSITVVAGVDFSIDSTGTTEARCSRLSEGSGFSITVITTVSITATITAIFVNVGVILRLKRLSDDWVFSLSC